MNKFINSHPFLCGIGCIIIGLITIRHTYKNPPKKPTPIPYVFEGYLGGGGFVILGIVFIIEGIINPK
jgi:hypothetical protein